MKTSPTLSFMGGLITIRLNGYGVNDGSGYFAFSDEDVKWEDGDMRIVEVEASEMIAIRDWLNSIIPPEVTS